MAADEDLQRLGHGWTELLKQVVFVASAIVFYFGVRGLTEGDEALAIDNGWWILGLEQSIGLDWERSIQAFVNDVPFFTTLVNWVYIWMHWPVIVATLVWLHHSHRLDYLTLRNAMFISGAIGMVIFAIFPVAPPRLLVDAGFVDTVTEQSTSYRVLQPPALVNKYAAVPSLHVGWNLLIGVAVFGASRRTALRFFAVFGPLLMAFAVVATANHYVIDGVVGAIVASTGLAASVVLTPRLAGTHSGSGFTDREVVENDAGHPEIIHSLE